MTHSTFCVTAVVVPGETAIPLAARLDDVVEYAREKYELIPNHAELHGHALVAAKEDWQQLKENVPARIDIYERAIAAIAGFDVRIYVRGADLSYHRLRYGQDKDPYVTVLPWTLERVQRHAERHDEQVLVVADEVARADTHRQALRDYQQFGTWGWRAQRLDRIADTIHFAPSRSSRLLQAVDLISYAHAQTSREHADGRAQAMWQQVWETLRPRIGEVSIWAAPYS